MKNIFCETNIICTKHVTKGTVETKSCISGGKREETDTEINLSNYLNSLFLNQQLKKNDLYFSNRLNQYLLHFQRRVKEYQFDVELFVFTKYSMVEIINDIVTCDERKTEYIRIIIKSDVRVFYEDFGIDLLFTEYLYELINKKIADLKELSKFKELTMDCSSPVIFSPGTGGYLMHEVVGHMLEIDNLANVEKKVHDKLSIGKVVSQKALNISDGVMGFEALLGLNEVDDEGNKLVLKQLVTDGKISSNINGDGCSRRTDFKLSSLPRMRATMIHNDMKLKFQEIVSLYPKAVIIDQILGGGVDIKSGNYQLVSNGRVFEKGIPVNRLENVVIIGDSINTLKNLEYIGDDLNCQHSYCVKKNQLIDIVVGSPTISIGNLELRGG